MKGRLFSSVCARTYVARVVVMERVLPPRERETDGSKERQKERQRNRPRQREREREKETAKKRNDKRVKRKDTQCANDTR